MRISDWSSDVCSSDLVLGVTDGHLPFRGRSQPVAELAVDAAGAVGFGARHKARDRRQRAVHRFVGRGAGKAFGIFLGNKAGGQFARAEARMLHDRRHKVDIRSEEHTSELQSLMRISYAVFCLKKKNTLTEQ